MIGRRTITKLANCWRCFYASWFIQPAMNCAMLISPGTTTQSARAGMALLRPTRPRLGSPEGKSGWEFGTNQRPREKGRERLCRARVASVSPAERAECTFVFVTPRNWPAKTDWAKGKNAAGDWKAVRAFDASDLEQWLEESIPAQMWLAEQLALPVSGFETLDECWRRWEEGSDPMMTAALFEPSIFAYRDTFKKWLEKPSEKPFVVAADSRDEAVAFLSCLFQGRGNRHRSGETSQQCSNRLKRCEPWQPRRHRSFRVVYSRRSRTRTGSRLSPPSLHHRSPPQCR